MNEWGLLIAASFLAAIVDSSVGGGGLIRLPAILAFGLPPHVALGTNKLAASGASSASAVQYWRSGLVQKKWAGPAWCIAVASSAIGAWAILHVRAEALVWMVIVVIAALLLFAAATPKFGLIHRPVARGAGLMALAALLLGGYDGFLGPGTGTFLIIAFVSLLGMDLRHAAAHGRVLNFGSNLGALALFATFGYVDWFVGSILFLTNVIGGLIGSSLTLRVDLKWIRATFFLVSAALLAKLLWQQLG